MSKEFDEYIADKPGLNLISKEELSVLKIKLGKSHRKESDWDVIKKILTSHDVITINLPKIHNRLRSVHGVLCEDNKLMVFTNIDDCESHIHFLHSKWSLDRYVNIVSLPLADVIHLADDNGMPVCIDITDKPNERFIIYYPELKELKAVILAKAY